ncbi:alpha/beta hydrolase [Acidobacteria bacterium ACD]|nr:MAG: alpha/beta hydrolase [Acidobacteriota bacterium]MCE7958094.1 alpha/beta hydrolase [Acidobacteria bacterium ACB2]MDL1949093.1 alpha/beta hydrolase [Acidobacteria bacterium ACD]
MVLRTELDWDRDVEPAAVSEDGTVSTFSLEADQPLLYFKPCLVDAGGTRWSVGANKLVLMTETDQRVSFPHFFDPEVGRFSSLVELPSRLLGRAHRIGAHLPPGYDENTLAEYPAVFLQDGQNLFFPEEVFFGSDWQVDDTGDVLRAMNAVEGFVILGIHSGDRTREYTKPDYEAYARSLVEEVVPGVERRGLRAGRHRRYRSVWGSSLGGVVSFYTVWQHPDVFGSAVCMSSTFSHRDDLIDRVFAEPFRDVGFYLDSGWPGENCEVTVGMAMAFITRGWEYGRNLLHLCFPNADHTEAAWGVRLHLPLQFLNGSVARAYRVHRPVLGDLPFGSPPEPAPR